jgi:hypothetical protein
MIKSIKILVALTVCFAIAGNAFSQNARTKANTTVNPNDVEWSTQGKVADSIPLPNTDAEQAKLFSTKATCFCQVSFVDMTNIHTNNAAIVCLDLTRVVNKTYNGQGAANQNDCNKRCTDVAVVHFPAHKEAVTNFVCGRNIPNGSLIRAFSSVGTTAYKTAQHLGVLVNTPQVTTTTCNCPTGWVSNTSNTNGGVTTDNKCRKLVCGPINATPAAPNGTPIGTWGVMWDNSVYVWGTAANGGLPVCTTVVTAPKICKIE